MKGLERGFTLIELLTGLAISVLLVGVLAALTISAQRSAAVEQVRADIATENRTLMDETTRHVKAASTVLASATVLGTLYTTGTQTLVLQTPAIDNNQNTITGINDLLVFRLIPNTSSYEFKQDAGTGSSRPDTSSRVFSERVSSLAFSYIDGNGNTLNSGYQNAKGVTLAITLADTVRNQTQYNALSDSATLRNK